MQNPHDKLFKETFTYPEVAPDFIAHYVPEEITRHIDLTTITLQKDTFIQKELTEFYSDLLLQVSFAGDDGYIYILFEHKSYPDAPLTLQLFRYMIEIWQRETEKERDLYLPIILPIVLYQGKNDWKKPPTLGDLINGGKEIPVALQPYVPDFEFLFYNFSPYGTLEIKGSAKLQAYLQTIKHIYGEDPEKLYSIVIGLDQAEEIDFLETIMLYLLHLAEHFSVPVLKERLTMEGRKKLMTAAEKLRREGERKSLFKIAKRMIELGKTDEEIKELTDLTKHEIEALRK